MGRERERGGGGGGRLGGVDRLEHIALGENQREEWRERGRERERGRQGEI